MSFNCFIEIFPLKEMLKLVALISILLTLMQNFVLSANENTIQQNIKCDYQFLMQVTLKKNNFFPPFYEFDSHFLTFFVPSHLQGRALLYGIVLIIKYLNNTYSHSLCFFTIIMNFFSFFQFSFYLDLFLSHVFCLCNYITGKIQGQFFLSN